MCEFCIRHGEGKKWYLQARNYSQDLLSDVRRQEFIAGFFRGSDNLQEGVEGLRKAAQAPAFVRRAISRRVTRQAKKQHFGQVLPLEDVREIFGFVNQIVRVPCVCRHATLGREARYCYGVSMGADRVFGDAIGNLDDSFLFGPNSAGLETLTAEAALEAFAGHEREGLCHTVWTFVTPFIGGVCNCDRSDCLAMRSTVTHDFKVMFRAEYVAEVNPDQCKGCRSCMRLCQFGAMAYSAANQKAFVDQRACYGCGVCRSACSKDAIALHPRAEVAAVAKLW